MKVKKIKSTRLRTVGKVILWVMISFIAAKGAVDILSGNTIAKQKQALEDYMETISVEESIKTGAMSFAEEFTREYLTFDGAIDSDYETRVGDYTSKDLRIDSPEKGATIYVVSTNAVSIAFINKQQVDVIVAAEIKVGSKISKLNIKVPIATKKGLYVVDEYPQIVSRAAIADVGAAEITENGSEVPNTTKEQITPIVDSFLKTYYDGSESDLMYFLTENSKVKRGLEGTVKFDQIDSIRIFYSTTEDLFLIDTKIKVHNYGVALPQHLYIEAKQEGDRYYIVDIKTRV